MARRRTDMPLMILVVGIFVVVGFGGMIIYFSGNTPILKLVPELEKRYGVSGTITTRFVPGGAPSIQVHVPASLVPDDAALADVAVFSLEKYREIAGKQTRVESCLVQVKDTSPPRQLRVTLALCRSLARARDGVREIQLTTQRAGLSSPEVQVLGLARTGAHVRVTARTQRGDAGALADRTVAAISSLSYVGRVEVALEAPSGKVSRRGGRDGP